jgi:hypothetical protein
MSDVFFNLFMELKHGNSINRKKKKFNCFFKKDPQKNYRPIFEEALRFFVIKNLEEEVEKSK